MLGLSFSKIALIILVAVIAWRGLRIYQQLQSRAAQRAAAPGPQRASATKATDLVECPRCGTFVPNGTICRSVEECRFRPAS